MLLVTLSIGAMTSHPAGVSAAEGFRIHVVRQGETLSEIAAANDLDLQSLADLNQLADPDRLAPGVRLVISGRPAVTLTQSTTAPAGAASATTTASTYRVRADDTLIDIANRFGIDVETLARVNGITDLDAVRLGAVLTIPTATRTAANPDKGFDLRHEVEDGDTLTSIAAHYGVTVSAIADVNRIADPRLLRIGQHLTIPTRRLPVPPPDVRVAVQRAAVEHGLDPYLVLGLSYLESGWRMDAVSRTGAVGMMQLMPDAALDAMRSLGFARLNWRTSLHDNTRAGASYLDHLLWLADGDVGLALASYYQGWSSVDADGILAETEQYVDDVLALVERFRAGGSVS